MSANVREREGAFGGGGKGSRHIDRREGALGGVATLLTLNPNTIQTTSHPEFRLSFVGRLLIIKFEVFRCRHLATDFLGIDAEI
ncbi:MAG: hypothetical protein U5K70_07890 [Halodesulfurarchaeum sp.]|nr:hypothetical protein [Halodesulfurarchaeum sp.]